MGASGGTIRVGGRVDSLPTRHVRDNEKARCDARVRWDYLTLTLTDERGRLPAPAGNP
jgi:hypothetical protein